VIARVAAGVARAREKGLLTRAWLFGSFAWGVPSAHSDIDLLLEGARDPFLAAAVIESGLGREVDVLRIERAPRNLLERVLADGLPL
jgi:predicted nucleotidyltransferase